MMHGKSSILLLIGALLLIVVSTVWASSGERRINQEGCVGDPSCYEEPTPEQPSSGGWPGDDRLNPVADEYYTVYCQYDLLEVWGGAPSPQLISAIPILLLLSGPFPADGGNGLTVNRPTDDTITISGASGYGPNHPGSKSFSLSECIARNGRVPEAPEEPLQSGTPSSEESESENYVATCLSLSNIGDITDCLWSAPSLSSLEVLWLLLFQFCGLPGFTLVFAAPGSVFLRRLRRRRKGGDSRQ